MAPRILILLIVLGAECSFYVKAIAAFARQCFWHNNSVLAIVYVPTYLSLQCDQIQTTATKVEHIISKQCLNCFPTTSPLE